MIEEEVGVMSRGGVLRRMAVSGVLGIAVFASCATAAVAADQTEAFASQASFATDGSGPSNVALSDDGSTALVVSSSDDSATIYSRSGSSWDESAALTPPVPVADLTIGSMAFSTGAWLSADGTTAVVGASTISNAVMPGHNDLLVYVLSGTTWTLQQTLASPAGAASTSVSADGNTILVAGSSTADIYSRSDGRWTETQLPATGIATCCEVAALSGDGNTAVLGSWNAVPLSTGTADPGGLAVMVRQGGSWTLQQTIPMSADAGPTRYNALSMAALSSDGNTLALASESNGATWIYSRSGGAWTEQQKLAATDTGDGDPFEYWAITVSMSDDGNTVLIGGEYVPDSDPHIQCVTLNYPWAVVFGRTGSSWSQEQKIKPTDSPGGGFGVLSGDGSTVAMGVGDSLSIYSRSDGASPADTDPYTAPFTAPRLAPYAAPNESCDPDSLDDPDSAPTGAGTTAATTTTTSTPPPATTVTTPPRPTSAAPTSAVRKTRTVTVEIDGRKATLTLPAGKLETSLKGSFSATATAAKGFRFGSAAVYLDKGVKHVEKAAARASRRARVVYLPDATIRKHQASFNLSLKALKRGEHALRVVITYARGKQTVIKTMRTEITVVN